jgi:hypothetical protein
MHEAKGHGHYGSALACGGQEHRQPRRWVTDCAGCTHVRNIIRRFVPRSVPHSHRPSDAVFAYLVARHRAE